MYALFCAVCTRACFVSRLGGGVLFGVLLGDWPSFGCMEILLCLTSHAPAGSIERLVSSPNPGRIAGVTQIDSPSSSLRSGSGSG